MTDTSKRELIREARAWAALIGTKPKGARELFNRLADALESDTVFEQATTPTDDEREALAEAIRRGSGASRYQSELLADQALLHLTGFRRTAVQEPSAEPTDAQVLAALNAWYAKEREQNGWPIGSNAAELADYSPQTQDRMRAALRAAYEAEQGWGHGEHVFIERYGVYHAFFGGTGGDVSSLTLTREAWKALGEADVLAVSVLPVEQEKP